MKFFLDTNIIIHHIIFSKLKKRIKKRLSFLGRYEKAYEIIRKIIISKNKDDIFIISFLAHAEMYPALFDEYRCNKMYESGIPMSSWSNNKFKIRLTNEEIEEIKKDILEFTIKNIFLEGDKEKRILSVWDIYDYDIIAKLIFQHGVRTHDALLISTAISEGCEYFITSDKELREIKNFDKISFINPEEALKKMNN